MSHFIPEKRITFLSCPLDALTMAETLMIIDRAIQTRTRLQHVVVNVAKLVNMQKDRALFEDVVNSDLINIDGMGVVWGARLLGHAVPERVAGIDIMDQTLKLCAEKGYRPYFLGAKPDVLARAVAVIQKKYPALHIAGAQHGYFTRAEEAGVMQAIADSNADCLYIAISSPTKERLLSEYRDTLNTPFLMGVGGSIDVFAGHVKRAPDWMQRMGLEWFYRLAQEPKRMFARYARTNSLFALLILRAFVREKLLSRQSA